MCESNVSKTSEAYLKKHNIRFGNLSIILKEFYKEIKNPIDDPQTTKIKLLIDFYYFFIS